MHLSQSRLSWANICAKLYFTSLLYRTIARTDLTIYSSSQLYLEGDLIWSSGIEFEIINNVLIYYIIRTSPIWNVVKGKFNQSLPNSFIPLDWWRFSRKIRIWNERCFDVLEHNMVVGRLLRRTSSVEDKKKVRGQNYYLRVEWLMGENINYWQIFVNWADGVFVCSLVEYFLFFFTKVWKDFIF